MLFFALPYSFIVNRLDGLALNKGNPKIIGKRCNRLSISLEKVKNNPWLCCNTLSYMFGVINSTKRPTLMNLASQR
jgi:hypothetical protein